MSDHASRPLSHLLTGLVPVAAGLVVLLCITSIVSCARDSNERVEALLRVRMADQANIREYEVFRQTQAALITCPFIVSAALKDPALSELRSIKSRKDPVKWIQKNVDVDHTGDSEILRVSCGVTPSEEAKIIVDAVIKAYHDEVHRSESAEHLARMELLREQQLKARSKIAMLTEDIQRMTAEVGADDSRSASMKQELAMQLVSALQNRVLGLEEKLFDARAQRLMLDDGELADHEQKRIEVYGQLLAEQKQLLENTIQQVQDQERFSSELVLKQHELEAMMNESQVLAHEIAQLQLALISPSRVELLQRATN